MKLAIIAATGLTAGILFAMSIQWAEGSESITDAQFAECLASTTHGINERLIANYQLQERSPKTEAEAIAMADAFFLDWAEAFRVSEGYEAVDEYYTRLLCGEGS